VAQVYRRALCDNHRDAFAHGWRSSTKANVMTMRYEKPDWLTKNIFNPLIMLATRVGISMRGSRILAVRGRKSGELRTTPVNLLEFEDRRYLVAPRGNTQWVRNVRAAGGGELRLGSKREAFRAVELMDAEKPPLLRAYLKAWSMETGKFFDNVKHDAPDEEITRIAPNHPVFRIES
jgi:deazaflavin-dependent oxidoreductase (nitroreductase family)